VCVCVCVCCVYAAVCVFVLAWKENEMKEVREKDRGAGGCMCAREMSARRVAADFAPCFILGAHRLLFFCTFRLSFGSSSGGAGNVGSLSVSIFQSPRVMSTLARRQVGGHINGESVQEILAVLARVSVTGVLIPGFLLSLSLSLSLSSPLRRCKQMDEREGAILAYP